MTDLGVDHRPNVLFNLVGVVLIVAGLGLTIYGLVAAVGVMQAFDPLHGDGPPLGIVDGMATAFWGIIVFTIGRYFWRGARKRGARDRFGRLLIIAGYLLLGVGLDTGMHAASGLWTEGGTSGGPVLVRTLITVAAWAIPGSILAGIGFKLANEKALAKAEVKAKMEYKIKQG
ncbi:hypothetical protein AB0E69_22335 [Kribbella sp. NPDC026611]|uniref:hypothetical protein n=1 Tax=Kribbella sp. NPDC026611 TaxID=3154911 RepID=UPI0033D35E98